MDSSITQALYKSFIEEDDCDVTFFIKEQDVKAHKFVLNLRSEVLKTMINNELSYENGKIVINDPEVGAEDFKEFLKFLYTDDCKTDNENVKVLLHLGHMYLVPTLLEKCASFIQTYLPKTNFLAALQYAELGLLYENDCSLIDKCLKYISTNSFLLDEHRLSAAKVSVELVLKIVKDCPRTNSCTEDQIFKAVLKWAEFECFRKKIDKTSPNLKAVMKDMIPFIKFDQLKPMTLAATVAYHNFLSDKETLEVICKSVIQEFKSPSGQSVTSPGYSSGGYYADNTGFARPTRGGNQRRF